MEHHIKESDPFTFFKTRNGFILHEQPTQNGCVSKYHQFVFKNVDELCEWIKEYYKAYDKLTIV